MDSVLTEFIDYVIDLLEIPENDEQTRDIIDNFIQIVDGGNNFPVKLDDIVEWLDVYPHKIRTTLTNSYKEGVDYIRTKEKMPSGQYKYVIVVSKDCFKELCLKTKSNYGNLIRKYFVVIEKMYREYMLNSILNRQRADGYEYGEKKYKKPNYPTGNSVYILRILENNNITYKIGFTDNINRRLYQHRRNIPGKISIVLYEIYHHHRFLESCLHRFLEKYNKPMRSKSGKNLTEIFETDVDKIRKLIKACRQFSQSPEMKTIADA